MDYLGKHAKTLQENSVDVEVECSYKDSRKDRGKSIINVEVYYKTEKFTEKKDGRGKQICNCSGKSEIERKLVPNNVLT